MKTDALASSSSLATVSHDCTSDINYNEAHEKGLINRKSNTKLIGRTLRVVYFIVGVTAIFAFTYLFGHPLLEGPLKGNDSGYALSIIDWIDRWFPDLPAWYPLQGGGTSSIVTYPHGAHLLVVIIHRITGINLVQVFRLVQLSSVAITAVGIYVLIWVKLRNQTMALIAGLSYPLSAAVWPWLTDVGIFGQAVSIVFFTPTFLLFDVYLTSGSKELGKKIPLHRCLIFPATSILFCILFLTHGATAVVLAMTMIIYSILLPFTNRGRYSQRSEITRNVLKALGVILVGLLLSSFWLFPYFRYGALANREGAGGEFALHQIPYLDLAAIVGLREPPEMWGMWALNLASSVVIMAVVGFVMGLRRKNFAMLWGVISIALAIFTAMPGIWPSLVGVFKKLWANTYVRALIPTMIFVPSLAGYGVGELARLIVDMPARMIRIVNKNRQTRRGESNIASILKSGATAIFSMAIAFLAFIYLRHTPAGYSSYPGYGATVTAAYWPFDFDGNGITWSRKPDFDISTIESPVYAETVQALIENLGLDQNTRIDISPYLGGFLQALPLYTDASTINIYSYGASLFHAMWGYQQGSFFSDQYGTPHEIDELARWLGIEYVVLNLSQDPINKYDEKRWPIVLSLGEVNYTNMQVRQFSDATGLVSLLRRPTILVIGGYEHSIYEQVFKTFNAGAVEYKDALIIEGSHRIDDYTVEELVNFDLIFLHGYDYKDRDRAWNILGEYVANGGSLFVDTGWQYWTPDWQSEQAPDVLPVRNLVWTDFGIMDEFSIEDRSVADGFDVNGFAPMDWEGDPWGVSFPSQGLREWARPVLNLDGQTLVAAGRYGEGPVVWSGMNLIGHLSYYENIDEQMFLGSLVQWLLPYNQWEELQPPVVQREHPDRIVFSIKGPLTEGTQLIWREAHSPDWQAFLILEGKKVDVAIYRAGPGMMLLQLPQIDADELTVTLEYGFGWISWAGRLLSLSVLGCLVVGVLFPNKFVLPVSWLLRFSRDPHKDEVIQRLRGVPVTLDHQSGVVYSQQENLNQGGDVSYDLKRRIRFHGRSMLMTHVSRM